MRPVATVLKGGDSEAYAVPSHRSTYGGRPAGHVALAWERALSPPPPAPPARPRRLGRCARAQLGVDADVDATWPRAVDDDVDHAGRMMTVAAEARRST